LWPPSRKAVCGSGTAATETSLPWLDDLEHPIAGSSADEIKTRVKASLESLRDRSSA
jgi:hypothetical protein